MQLRRLIQAALFSKPTPDIPQGEQHAGPVPASVIRGALAQAGGLPPDSPGVTDRGTLAADSGPLTGLATGHTATSWVEDRGGVSLGYEWQYYGIRRNEFPPHRALSGKRFTAWDDEVLRVPAGYQWMGIVHLHPGDHDGCLCGYLPVMAVPMDPNEGRALADLAQITETKGQRESRVLLAEMDDAAGRTGTVAQQQRDARQELIRLRRIHIDERESK